MTVQIGSVAEETIPNHVSFAKCQVGIVVDMRHPIGAKGLLRGCLITDSPLELKSIWINALWVKETEITDRTRMIPNVVIWRLK